MEKIEEDALKKVKVRETSGGYIVKRKLKEGEETTVIK